MTRTYVTILLSRESKQRNEKNKQFTFVCSCNLFYLTRFYWENRCLQNLRNTVALNSYLGLVKFIYKPKRKFC